MHKSKVIPMLCSELGTQQFRNTSLSCDVYLLSSNIVACDVVVMLAICRDWT